MGKIAALVAGMVVFTACTSCSHEPPPYESHYTQPTSATPIAPEAPLASWSDNFDRPDTELGLGEGWDMRGAYAGGFPLPTATDGFIRDGHYTYAGDSIVYAVRQFRGTVRRIGAIGRWAQIRPGPDTTLAIAITPNDQLITDRVHFIANRNTWALTVRHADGALEPVSNGTFAPPLELNHDYWFEIEATDTALTVRVPGREITEQVSTVGLLGDRAFWEEYIEPDTAPAGTVFDFGTVWAVEDGQPLAPS